MIEYINDNSGFFNVILSAGTLLVWLLYFQLLYFTYREQTRPNILINRGAGTHEESRCLISNMSASPVYLQVVMLKITVGDRNWTCAISDLTELSPDTRATHAVEETHQGPLAHGEFIDIGTFSNMLRKAANACGKDDRPPQRLADIDAVEVTVAAIYTGRNDFVGAYRTFDIRPESEGRAKLDPRDVFTSQIASRAMRRDLKRQIVNVT